MEILFTGHEAVTSNSIHGIRFQFKLVPDYTTKLYGGNGGTLHQYYDLGLNINSMNLYYCIIFFLIKIYSYLF